jgi:hypothetical protein
MPRHKVAGIDEVTVGKGSVSPVRPAWIFEGAGVTDVSAGDGQTDVTVNGAGGPPANSIIGDSWLTYTRSPATLPAAVAQFNVGSLSAQGDDISWQAVNDGNNTTMNPSSGYIPIRTEGMYVVSFVVEATGTLPAQNEIPNFSLEIWDVTASVSPDNYMYGLPMLVEQTGATTGTYVAFMEFALWCGDAQQIVCRSNNSQPVASALSWGSTLYVAKVA